MHERQRNRNRFFNAKNITIGSGIITFLGKLIYDDLKKENSFIKGVFKNISVSLKNKTSNNKVLNNSDSTKKIESDNIKK